MRLRASAHGSECLVRGCVSDAVPAHDLLHGDKDQNEGQRPMVRTRFPAGPRNRPELPGAQGLPSGFGRVFGLSRLATGRLRLLSGYLDGGGQRDAGGIHGRYLIRVVKRVVESFDGGVFIGIALIDVSCLDERCQEIGWP